MNITGENLLIKMWDSLINNGIGGLLQPWQIRRVGTAETDVLIDRQERLLQIEKSLYKNSVEEKLLITDQSNNNSQTENFPELKTILQKITDKNLSKLIRKEFNIARAIIWAEKTLENDTSQVPKDNIDQDWLSRWQDYAGDTSSELLQSLWGKILAGEIKSPSKFSLRALDFLKNLSQKEAEKIQKIFSLALRDGTILKDKNLLTSKKNRIIRVIRITRLRDYFWCRRHRLEI